jgi:hypothetical protein
MPYTPVTWQDGVTPVNAANLNTMEDGIESLDALPKIPIPLVEGNWLKTQGGAMVWADVNAEYQARSEKAQVNGYASLGADGKVPTAQLPALGAPPLVTVLPASPTDGQEVILTDSLTAPTYQWGLRYRAGSTHVHKWEFIGGTSLTAEVGADQSTATSGAWVDLATVGPQMTVPRAGLYDIGYGSDGYVSSTTGQLFIGPAAGATTPLASIAFVCNVSQQNIGWSVARLTLATGDLRLRYYQSSALTAHWVARRMTLVPVRIA